MEKCSNITKLETIWKTKAHSNTNLKCTFALSHCLAVFVFITAAIYPRLIIVEFCFFFFFCFECLNTTRLIFKICVLLLPQHVALARQILHIQTLDSRKTSPVVSGKPRGQPSCSAHQRQELFAAVQGGQRQRQTGVHLAVGATDDSHVGVAGRHGRGFWLRATGVGWRTDPVGPVNRMAHTCATRKRYWLFYDFFYYYNK